MSVESGVCISCDGSICSENRLRNGTRCLTPEREQTCHVSASCSKDDARGHMAGWRRIWCNLKLQWKKGATLIRLKKAEVKSAYERGRWGSCAKRNCSCFRTWGCMRRSLCPSSKLLTLSSNQIHIWLESNMAQPAWIKQKWFGGLKYFSWPVLPYKSSPGTRWASCRGLYLSQKHNF